MIEPSNNQHSLISGFEKNEEELLQEASAKRFKQLLKVEHRIGDMYSLDFGLARVSIHDHHREKVGGVPHLCFLLASRVDPKAEKIEYDLEDSNALLLRVTGKANLPNEGDAERIRIEAAQRISGEPQNWDSQEVMDGSTHSLLGYGAVECNVLGTFYLERSEPEEDKDPQIIMKFGSDISNYYSNRGFKVYKPADSALSEIVNYYKEQEDSLGQEERVSIGRVRYASTNRKHQGIDGVPFGLSPSDLLAQKSALFGMTRTGKSNTTKIIAKSIFNLRHLKENPLRVGQLVFDPNGEYANDNVQDKGSLKKIGTLPVNSSVGKEVITYGVKKHDLDKDRKLMLLNFFDSGNLEIGKGIINDNIARSDTKYIENFRDVSLQDPTDPDDRSAVTRHKRRILVYRTLLFSAGFTPPDNIKPFTGGLFNEKLLKAMDSGQGSNPAAFTAGSKVLGNKNPEWAELVGAFKILDSFIKDRKKARDVNDKPTDQTAFERFNKEYVEEKSGRMPWADDELRSLLEMFTQRNGSRLVGRSKEQHTHETSTDYADEIYDDLCSGRLVIVDQATGSPDMNDSSARRIMRRIFESNLEVFGSAKTPPEIIVYLEEAHNLLPEGSSEDLKDIWVRTAKEGGKCRIGIVYATQEVSSIQRNILKNTANLFVSHLNNTDETRELRKYYDFADFESSILKAQDKGFLRIKTLSNPFVVPVQVEKFEV